jgi:predicted metalloprotease with PDZ domain
LGETFLIRYRLQMPDVTRHYFEVQCRIANAKAVEDLSLPSWIPGSYLLREFARHVVAFSAESASGAVETEKIDHRTWRCRNVQGELTTRATIYALDQSVRGAYLDTRRAYFNGACVFFCPHGREHEPVELEIVAPLGADCATWRVATALQPVEVDVRGFGIYRAEDYDELIDHPVEISDFDAVAFKAAGVVHQLVLAGRHASDLNRVADDVLQLCETQIEFFGRPPPFDRYWFLGLAVGDGYGGLEHRASSSLIFSRDDLPKPGEPGMPKEYQRFLGLVSHEYFHSWLVKRIKPRAFEPYRLDRRAHTRLLWVFEGITSYYQYLLLRRAELIGAEAYLARLGEVLTHVYRSPGRARQSLAEASFDAWDIFYKPDANSANAGVSYYSKGALVALALDLTLRRDTNGKLSLDSIMNELWRRYAQTGVGEKDFEALVTELAGPRFAGFFDAAVRGVEDLPLAPLLAAFGVSLNFRVAGGPEDKGGTARVNGEVPELTLGAAYRARDGGLELTSVLEGGVAQRAGLNPGDIVIALDGLRVHERNARQRLARLEAGERIEIAFYRGDELCARTLELVPAPPDTCYLTLEQGAAPEVLTQRAAWIGD